jgi:hypothetical protein
MSATTEILLEEIKEIEIQLLEARKIENRDRIQFLEVSLKDARKRLTKANESLVENRSILKG